MAGNRHTTQPLITYCIGPSCCSTHRRRKSRRTHRSRHRHTSESRSWVYSLQGIVNRAAISLVSSRQLPSSLPIQQGVTKATSSAIGNRTPRSPVSNNTRQTHGRATTPDTRQGRTNLVDGAERRLGDHGACAVDAATAEASTVVWPTVLVPAVGLTACSRSPACTTLVVVRHTQQAHAGRA